MPDTETLTRFGPQCQSAPSSLARHLTGVGEGQLPPSHQADLDPEPVAAPAALPS